MVFSIALPRKMPKSVSRIVYFDVSPIFLVGFKRFLNFYHMFGGCPKSNPQKRDRIYDLSDLSPL
jgi:hypothetical protein